MYHYVYTLYCMAAFMNLVVPDAAASISVETKIIGGRPVVDEGKYPWYTLPAVASQPSGAKSNICGGGK